MGKLKILLFVFVVLVTGLTVAEDLGLTVGVEFMIENVHRENDGDMMPWLAPFVVYEDSFLDEALDLYSELSFWFGFFEENPVELYFNLAAAFNLFLSPQSTLSFLLENEIDTFMISPRPDEGSGMRSIIKPGIGFRQIVDFGNIYAGALLPITYLNYYSDADTEVALEATLSFFSDYGFGISFTPVFSISPESGYDEIRILPSYETDTIYVGVEVILPSEFDDYGITITPEVIFNITGNFGAYMRCEVAGIGSDAGMILAPAVGIMYSF